jgi:hypothetical protein
MGDVIGKGSFWLSMGLSVPGLSVQEAGKNLAGLKAGGKRSRRKP